MVLTSSDIGADPEKIESFLSDGFKTASSWGAVLLIDEADVFMERRSSNDLNRNCLVAGTYSPYFTRTILIRPLRRFPPSSGIL
jgi:hypothetical protein